MKTLTTHSGAIAIATTRAIEKKSCENLLYAVVRCTLRRLGISPAQLSIGMGYASPQAVSDHMRKCNKRGYAKRNVIEAIRDLGASRDEMAALIAAYIQETGDTSFITTPEGRARLAKVAVDILEENGGLYRPGGNQESPIVSRERIKRYAAHVKKQMAISAKNLEKSRQPRKGAAK